MRTASSLDVLLKSAASCPTLHQAAFHNCWHGEQPKLNLKIECSRFLSFSVPRRTSTWLLQDCVFSMCRIWLVWCCLLYKQTSTRESLVLLGPGPHTMIVDACCDTLRNWKLQKRQSSADQRICRSVTATASRSSSDKQQALLLWCCPEALCSMLHPAVLLGLD